MIAIMHGVEYCEHDGPDSLLRGGLDARRQCKKSLRGGALQSSRRAGDDAAHDTFVPGKTPC